MKRQTTKQVIMSLLGLGACQLTFAGCYPFIPAYYAAGYLESGARTMLSTLMFAGMAVLLPITEMVKYLMAMFVTMAVIRFAEWANKGCFVWIGALAAAVSTTLVSVFGGLMNLRTRTPTAISLMEGIFIFGATLVISRGLHMFLEWRPIWRKEEKTSPPASREERLLTYAQSFQGLSAVFNKMNVDHSDFGSEEMGRIQNEITGKLCASCDSCAVCWDSPASPMYDYLSGLIESIRQVGKADQEMQTRLQEYCPYGRDMVEEAVAVFERARLNMAWYNRLLENREVIAEQLDAMAYIMEDCAKESRDISHEKKRNLMELTYRARERGLRLNEAKLYEKADGRLQLQIRAVARNGCVPVREMTKAVEHSIDRPMMPHRDVKAIIGREEALLIYEEDTIYKSIQGVARLIKDGAAISGDNFSFLERENGQVIMSLSDGMGSGSRACKESEMVIELVEKFLEAGFGVETAIRMMNSAMVMKGEDDLFSTVDISVIDLYSGNCEIFKIGASATFIRHKNEVECLLSTSLPVGVYHKLEIEQMTKRLRDGDFLVMVTDGVLEYLHVLQPEETLQEIIESIDTNNPGTMAKKILERVLLFTGGKVSDDMTVLVSGIWEK